MEPLSGEYVAHLSQSMPDSGLGFHGILGTAVERNALSMDELQADESRLAARAEGEQMLEAAEAAMEVTLSDPGLIYSAPYRFGSNLLCPVSIRI